MARSRLPRAVVIRRVEQLARLVIAERRRLAFAGFGFWALDAFDRVVGDCVLLTQIFEQRGQRCEPVADRAAAEAAPHQLVAPGDDMRPRRDPKFLGPPDAGKAHEVLDGVFVDAAGAGVVRLANHSTSGDTSATRWNSAVVRRRPARVILVGPVTAKLCKMAIQERGRPQISKE
jgi:hypothetical protein